MVVASDLFAEFGRVGVAAAGALAAAERRQDVHEVGGRCSQPEMFRIDAGRRPAGDMKDALPRIPEIEATRVNPQGHAMGGKDGAPDAQQAEPCPRLPAARIDVAVGQVIDHGAGQ